MSLIQFTNVSKKYIVRHNAVGSFHSSIIDRLRGSWITDEFWALRDVSFQIEKGETVGIIGANGSGKSTTLKLITRIVRPTTGRIVVDGTIASLLELGVGFHPELSGRENIYLFGSFHGLSPKEVRRQYDHIVEFSDLEDFIDQPVKHYSSGMYVRLAFSAALSVKSDILLLDEIFAVGDERFQRKCTTAITDAQRHGTTIVLVSHSLDLVATLCHRAIWMDAGRLTETGGSRDVGSHYLVRSHELDDQERVAQANGNTTHAVQSSAGNLPVAELGEHEGAGRAAQHDGEQPEPHRDGEPITRWGSGEVRITRVRLHQEDGTETFSFVTGGPMCIELRYTCIQRMENPVFGIAIYDAHNVCVTAPNSQFSGEHIPYIEGTGSITVHVPNVPLIAGTYWLSVAVCDDLLLHPYDHQERAYQFHINSPGLGERYGLVKLGPTWVHRHDATLSLPVDSLPPMLPLA